MLLALNLGEHLDPNALADKYKVSLRTVQRDLNVRFAYLPMERIEGTYRLDPKYLGKLTGRDIERFASLAGVKGLFPTLGDDFLRELLDDRFGETILVRGHTYEPFEGHEQLFESLEQAVRQRRRITLTYLKDDDVKRYVQVAPYKMLNHKGIWYLAAEDQSRLKTFALSRIKTVDQSNDSFEPAAQLMRQLHAEEGIWFTGHSQRVELRVAPEVARYFKRRRLIANQEVLEELQDGSLHLVADVGHPNQVLPIVRYWIPFIQIVKPKELADALRVGLEQFLTQNTVDQ